MGESNKGKLCEFCGEQPSSVLCTECCRCYCDECNKLTHGIKSKKGHKVETIPEGVIVNARCPLHKDNPFEMFCVDEVKLCCGICKAEDLYKGRSVVKVSDVPQDNEAFSAAAVKERFADVLKCDDVLDKKIEEAIENIRKEGDEAQEKVRQTFIEIHKKLEEEEGKVMKELESVCSESEEALQKNLKLLRETHEYSRTLSEADVKGNEFSRLMELNIVCSMEEQRRTMEELHGMMMTDLKVEWNNEGRKLSFTRTLFNGAPVPNNVKFPSVSGRGMDISWECDLSVMSEENKGNMKYVVEMKKGSEDEKAWREKYSGTDMKCSVSGLEKDTEYNVRVKCVVRGLHGKWSDVVNVKTKNITLDSNILLDEENGKTLEGKLFEWCGTNNFVLLYRGTRDGFGASDFHRMCDNRGKTLVLVKNTSGHVFGGFLTIPWTSPSSGTYKQAPGSFLFTLTNMHGIQPTKFPLKNENDEHAVYHINSYGPIFGGGQDIYICSNCRSNNSGTGFPYTYKDTTWKGNSIFSSSTSDYHFQVQEIEVFRVNV